jgi:hypothetical protein
MRINFCQKCVKIDIGAGVGDDSPAEFALIPESKQGKGMSDAATA